MSIKTLVVAAVAALLLAVPAVVLATSHFDDVDSTDPFAEDIDAIADAGVTLGCEENSYCPDDFVRRAQMAAFLNRLGAIDPDEEPVSNARSVNDWGVYSDIVSGVAYQLLGTPDSVYTFDVNVAASDRTPEEIDKVGEYLICFATIDGTELPDGTYTLFVIETHVMAPLTD